MENPATREHQHRRKNKRTNSTDDSTRTKKRARPLIDLTVDGVFETFEISFSNGTEQKNITHRQFARDEFNMLRLRQSNVTESLEVLYVEDETIKDGVQLHVNKRIYVALHRQQEAQDDFLTQTHQTQEIKDQKLALSFIYLGETIQKRIPREDSVVFPILLHQLIFEVIRHPSQSFDPKTGLPQFRAFYSEKALWDLLKEEWNTDLYRMLAKDRSLNLEMIDAYFQQFSHPTQSSQSFQSTQPRIFFDFIGVHSGTELEQCLMSVRDATNLIPPLAQLVVEYI